MSPAFRSPPTLNRGQPSPAVAPPSVQPRPAFTPANPAPDSSADYDATGVAYEAYHDAMVKNGHTKGMDENASRAHTMRNWLAHGPAGQAEMRKKLAPIYGLPITAPAAQPTAAPAIPRPPAAGTAPARAPTLAVPAQAPVPTTPGQVMDNVNAAMKAAIPRPPRTNDNALAARLQGGKTYDPNGPHIIDNGKPYTPQVRPAAGAVAPQPADDLQKRVQSLQDAARTMPAVEDKLNLAGAQLAVAKNPVPMQQRQQAALKEMGAVPALPPGGGVVRPSLKPMTAAAAPALSLGTPVAPRPSAPPAPPAQPSIDDQIAAERTRLDQARPLADRAIEGVGGAIATAGETVGKAAGFVADKTLYNLGKGIVGAASAVKDTTKNLFVGDPAAQQQSRDKIADLERQKTQRKPTITANGIPALR